MTLLYPQLQQFDPLLHRPAHAPKAGEAAGRVGAFCLALVCFLPYPALAIGNYTAIQAGNVLSLLLIVPLALQPWRRGGWWVGPALVVPLVLSTFHSSLVNAAEPSLSFKAMIVSGMSGVTLLVGQFYLRLFPLEMLSGMAIATLLHVAVGAWQLFAFRQGALPLEAIYVNPSFLSVQNNAQTIALYIQRPFGLFPEPSAMSSCLGPWAVFWVAEASGVIRLRQRPTAGQRGLFLAAATGSIALMIVSQSGHTAVVLAGMVVVGLAWLRKCRLSLRTYAAILLVFGVILPLVLWGSASSLERRIGDKSNVGNSSWEDRSNSLIIGLNILMEGRFSTLLFGMGPGLSVPAIHAKAKLDAVWSVLLTYLYETGVVGFFAVSAIGIYLADCWRRSGRGVAYLAFLGVWLVGITLTTSYSQLLPLWLAAAWLCVWPDVCQPAGAGVSAAADRSARQPQPTPVGWDTFMARSMS